VIEYKAVKPVPCFVSTKKTRQKCIGCDRIIEEHRGEITERKQSSVGSVLFSFLPSALVRRKQTVECTSSQYILLCCVVALLPTMDSDYYNYTVREFSVSTTQVESGFVVVLAVIMRFCGC